MPSQMELKRIRASNEFKDYIKREYKAGHPMAEIAVRVSSYFNIPVTKDYVSKVLYRAGIRQKQPQRNFKAPISPYAAELD